MNDNMLQYIKQLERRIARLEAIQIQGNGNTFTITNDLTDRTYDANSTTTAELADVLATLIRDLAANKPPKV